MTLRDGAMTLAVPPAWLADRRRIEVGLKQRFRNREEDDPPEQQDVVADAVEPRVGVANGDVDLQAGIEIAGRLMGERVDSIVEVIGPPHVHGKAGIIRHLLIKNRTDRGIGRPLLDLECERVLAAFDPGRGDCVRCDGIMHRIDDGRPQQQGFLKPTGFTGPLQVDHSDPGERQKPLLGADIGGQRFIRGRRGGRDEPVLACESVDDLGRECHNYLLVG